ncbi:hypothetical protein PHMEG_0004112 [Phytophthora megakarya]|uniref:Retrotransposon gag domain-containing protein n=1 Tax=Phytophthora megakarya TaxID=4795 RepID=A0A225WWX3_9STRA|nr:hypothetical protein PHMEG_0004112 [Phytophthora megakarya]
MTAQQQRDLRSTVARQPAKQRAKPPKFMGKQDEDLELSIFQIEEHFAIYTVERDNNDLRFVNLVIPFLRPDVMSWYREFKASIGETPRTWTLFKEQIRSRFRDSDFEFKLLTNMYDLPATSTQQEYTSKFMLLLSQSVDMPEVVKRWFYQQNLQYFGDPPPDNIEHAQRYEDARKPPKARQSNGPPGTAG